MYQNYTINQLCLPIDLEAKLASQISLLGILDQQN
ncbi:hypothetical protein CIRMBP1319_02248 [Enterococcus cecorum]|nr:hypothetical protein CIRMBP1319_02248 [Enterococcus cecorum]